MENIIKEKSCIQSYSESIQPERMQNSVCMNQVNKFNFQSAVDAMINKINKQQNKQAKMIDLLSDKQLLKIIKELNQKLKSQQQPDKLNLQILKQLQILGRQILNQTNKNQIKKGFQFGNFIKSNPQSSQRKDCSKIKMIYQHQFIGWNISFLSLWKKKDMIDLKNKFSCKIVRIGIVDIKNEFLQFFQQNGINISNQEDIRRTLQFVCSVLTEYNIYFILTLGNLPAKNKFYSRFVQTNSQKKQKWYSPQSFNQLKKLWRIIAQELSTKNCCIGYDLINKPTFQQKNMQSSQDLIKIYLELIQCIRQVDKQTPIILQPQRGNVYKIDQFMKNAPQQIIKDQKIIFSFHFYQPYV